ncbi:hypothetical protein RB620_29855 [Paenibacillus sp. LHD-117]|uniref:hypothetical protein n=1 Tax=Paenibacillus sp. LHD-117 TaxID=3071412 RepID=UPI0027DFC03B|nr:hypothetical protein [Paenibacillus sp. LHD-117]MDQ6423620.1 hypothetical protein [Paenibacillus sp. LHD-117]
MKNQLKPRTKQIIFLLSLLLFLTSLLIYFSICDLEIEYEINNGYSGYHSVLHINDDRSYSLMVVGQRGSPSIELIDNLSNRQAQSIRKVYLLNRLLILKKDLSNHSTEDNSIEKLRIKLGFLELETEGYGITNKGFRNIVKPLEELIAAQK